MENTNGMCEKDLVKLNKYMDCISMFDKVHTQFYDTLHHKISESYDMNIRILNDSLLNIIYQVGIAGKIPAGNVAERIKVTLKNLSYSFEKLEMYEIIESTPHLHDKRVRILSLTKKGKIIFEKIQKICLEHIHEIGDTLDQAQAIMHNINAFYTMEKKTFNKE